ncbi:MAG: DUF1611 domain-containing protein [Steroidobacteraceae bacterium]
MPNSPSSLGRGGIGRGGGFSLTSIHEVNERCLELLVYRAVSLGDAVREPAAKTAFGLRDWCREDCVGQWSLPAATVDLGLPQLPPGEVRAGAKSLIVAVAPVGGRIEETWVPSLVAAIEAGLDVVSGMHTRLAEVPALALEAAARRCGRQLIDVRHPRIGG